MPAIDNRPAPSGIVNEEEIIEVKNEGAESEMQYAGWSYGLCDFTHQFFIKYGAIHDTIIILFKHIEEAKNNNKSELEQRLIEKKKALDTHVTRLKSELYLQEERKDSSGDGLTGAILFNNKENYVDQLSYRFNPDILQLSHLLEGNVKALYDNAYPLLSNDNEKRVKNNFSEDQVNAQKQLPRYDYGNFSVVFECNIFSEKLKAALDIIHELKDKNNAEQYGESLRKDILDHEQYRQLVMELISTEYGYSHQCHQAIDGNLFLTVAKKYVEALNNKGATGDAAKAAAAILKNSTQYLAAINAYQNIQHVLPVSLSEMVHFSQDIQYGLNFMERAYSQTLLNNLSGPLVPILKRYASLSGWIAEVVLMHSDKNSSLSLDDNEKAMLSVMSQFLIAPIQRQMRYKALADDLRKRTEKVIDINENAQLILTNMQEVANRAAEEANNIEDQNKKLEEIRENFAQQNVSSSMLQSVFDPSAIGQSQKKEEVPTVNEPTVAALINNRPALNMDDDVSFADPRVRLGNGVIQDTKAKNAKMAHIFYYIEIYKILDTKEKRNEAYHSRNVFSRWWNKKNHHREQEALQHLLDIVKLAHENFISAYEVSNDFNESFDGEVKKLQRNRDDAEKALKKYQKQWLFNPFKRYKRSQLKKAWDAATEKYALASAAYGKFQEDNSPLKTPVEDNAPMRALYQIKKEAIKGQDYTTLRASNFYKDCVATSKRLWFFQRAKKKIHAKEVLLHKMRSKSKTFRKAVDSLMAGENSGNNVNLFLWSNRVVPIRQG